ncbi:MAG: Uma2 family endonuclease [Deltaproteobacteria bacterium]|jgi:Uma2 family endonuclease|nr:Uma2 family endonuclease [Deltaproteobacteria bacterium]
MEWREVVEHPSLKDLPFKIETNEWGKIMMAPASYTHALYQGIIIRWFNRRDVEGMVTPECPIDTPKGTKVADVAWASPTFIKKHTMRNVSLRESPEVVVEIESSSNTAAELEEKRHLYFEVGAREFWLCDEDGNMRFFNPRGELKRSDLFAEFPGHIDIDVL